MDMLGDLSAMSSIASLLVSMIGTVMTYIQLKQPNGAPPTAAAAAPQVIINADIITINVVLEDAIGDLGQEDRLIAKQLQAEVNKWLISRSTT
ncbi:hypothetical protein ABENE_16800 [Asticcacaulis benevestitus DSM 16100 = ATCC BAA-896]|uniref:Uncharacterized protein n=2 Tax=Asticcacaulis TaxID=76890 RepID=V4PHZ5_9CAUL|nr:hypothetical protein ABENE_16800 [Asticcacaulis benevestitus DSM 16100 = ATCC BAA-896]